MGYEIEPSNMVNIQTWEEQRDEIREELREFHTYERGEKLRKDLADLAKMYYEQKYSPETHIDFIKSEISSFSTLNTGPQCQNRRSMYQLFTISSQHVNGDCFEELIDNAITKSIKKGEYELSSM